MMTPDEILRQADEQIAARKSSNKPATASGDQSNGGWSDPWSDAPSNRGFAPGVRTDGQAQQQSSDGFGARFKPSAFESVKDSAIALGAGVTQGIGMLANVAGADNAVSRTMADATQALSEYESPYRKAEKQERARKIKEAEESGSTLKEVGAYLGSFAEAPLDTTLNALGTSLPTLAAGFIPGAGQAAVAARVAQAGLGAGQGVGAVKGQIFDEVKQAWKDKGITEEDAAARATQAQSYTGDNAGSIALGGVLGAGAGSFGAEASVRRLAGKELAERAAQTSMLKGMGMGALKEAPMEGLQGGQERLASNLALQNEGFDQGTWTGVAGNAALEATASAPMGAGFGAWEAGSQQRLAQQEQQRRAEIEQSGAADGELTLADEWSPPNASEGEIPPLEPGMNIDTRGLRISQTNDESAVPFEEVQVEGPSGPGMRIDTSGLSTQDYPGELVGPNPAQREWDTGGLTISDQPQKPSEAMGLRPGPDAGPLENAAALSVDTGATAQMQGAAGIVANDLQSEPQAANAIPVVDFDEVTDPYERAMLQRLYDDHFADGELESVISANADLDTSFDFGANVNQLLANAGATPQEIEDAQRGQASAQAADRPGQAQENDRGDFDAELSVAKNEGDGSGRLAGAEQGEASQQPLDQQATAPGSQAEGANVATLAQLNRKKLAEMSDDELQQLSSLLPADHNRQQKIQKAIQDRATQAQTATNIGTKEDAHQTAQAQQAIAQPTQAGAAQAGQPAGQGLNNGATPAENDGRQASAPTAPQAQAQELDRQQRAKRLDDAGAQWTRMPAAERSALVGRLDGVKPVLAKNMPKAEWGKLNVDIQRKMADAMTPVRQAGDQASTIRQGQIGMKLAAGETVLTTSGRSTTAFPKIDTSSNGKATNTFKRVDQWLMQNALDEATARGDEFNARQFEAALNNPQQADKDSAEQYLFGEQPQVVPSILKPLTAAPKQNQPQDNAKQAQEATEQKAAPGRQSTESAYTLPSGSISDEWRDDQKRSPEHPDFTPTPRQQRLMDEVKKVLDSGAFYNDDVTDKVAKALGVSDEVLASNRTRVQGGDFGYDVYHARQAVQAKALEADAAKIRAELNLRAGDKLGTLIFNDFKQTNSVEVVSVTEDGRRASFKGKRGAATVTFEATVPTVKFAIERAHEKGKRKDSYEEFIAGRSANLQEGIAASQDVAQKGQPTTQPQQAQAATEKVAPEVGPFGPILTQYYHDAQGAIKALTALQDGEAVAALYHPDVGDIDLVWGKEGTSNSDGLGLAKLVKWHPEVLGDLQGFLNRLRKDEATSGPNRIRLVDGRDKAVVRLQWNGKAKNWLLTAFESNAPKDSTRTDTGAADVKDDTASLNPERTQSVPQTNTTAQPITRADVEAAQQQAAAIIGARIDGMSAGDVNKIAKKFLPTMGMKPTMSKANNKAAMTDPKINLEAAAAEVGATLPAEVTRALQADMEGRVVDVAQDDGVTKEMGQAQTESKAPAEPNPIEHTPKQYADAWLRWSAETNALPLAEVREMQGDEAGLKAIEQRWVDAVVQEAKSGQPLPAKTLDKLLEVRPNTQLPESAIPDGYQRPEARKAEKEEAAARKAKPEKIEDFGEKLEGARKDLPPSLKEEVSDEQMASLPLSKIWPANAHEEIQNDAAAALAFAARQEIPAKPRQSVKVQRWVQKVKSFRALVTSDEALAGQLDKLGLDGLSQRVVAGSALEGFFAKVRLLAQLPRDTWGRVEKVREYPDAVRYGEDGQKTPIPFSAVVIDGEPHQFDGAKSIGPDEVQKVKEMLGTAAPKKGGLTPADFEVRGTAKTGYKINRKGDSEYRSLKIFTGEDAAKKALAWRDEHTAELEAAWEAVKARDNVGKGDVRTAQNRQRVGADHRKGADVTAQMFEDAFSFRGVQFGNWVAQGAGAKDRQGLLNEAYDALMDLSLLLGVPSRAMSLNGSLGLSLGARGSGKAAAHFEPNSLVINLTKTKGAGSLAHEWFHALDNYFSRMRGGEVAFAGDNNAYRQNNFVTYKPEAAWGKAPITPYTNFMRGGQLRERLQRLPGFTYDANKTLAENAKAAGFERDPNHKEGVRPQVEKAFADLVQALNDSPMAKRASAMDKAADGYWGRIIERGARSFENYVINKMALQGYSNDFLANIRNFDEWQALGKNAERYPYLTPAEEGPVVEAFDNLFETIETRQGDDGNVELYFAANPARRPGTAQDKAVMQAIADGKSARDVLRLVASGSKDPFLRQVARLLLKAGITPSIQFGYIGKTEKGDPIHGQYRGESDTIAIAGSAEYAAERIFMHEAMHAATMRALAKPGLPRLQLQKLLEHVRKQPGAAGFYGTKNVDEFVAEVFTNPDFQAALRKMNAPSGSSGIKTAWDGFVRILRSILGLKNDPNNALSQALQLGVAAVREDMGLRKQGVRTEGAANFGVDDFARNVGEGIKSITATNIKKVGSHKLTDWLKLGLQFLGRRQLVDVYGDLIPQMRDYDRLAAQMEADKNESGAEADELVRRWAKLPDEGKLADLMHEATLAQVDADADVAYVAGDDKAQSAILKNRFKALSPEAQAVYREARDGYKAHHEKVRKAIRERIERSELSSPKRHELLAKMDDDFFQKVKGVYFQLARFGRYVTAVKDGNGQVVSVSRAETMPEAESARVALLKAFPAENGFSVGRVTLDKEFVASHKMVGRGFMTDLYRSLEGVDLPTDQLAELEDTLGQLYLSSLPDLSWAKHGIHRKGTPGFSQDARRAFAQNMFHGARYLAKLRYSDVMQDSLDAMQEHVDEWGAVTEEFDQPKAQRVVDEMLKRHDAMMNPKSNPLSTALTSFGFLYYLGLSPAAAMVNLSQTALVAYPVMAGKWGYKKSADALLRASKESVAGKNNIRTQLTDKDEIAAYEQAVNAGVIDVTMAHDLAGIAQGEDQKVSWALRPVMRMASYMFHQAELFNRQSTFMAAFRLAREAGATPKDAYEQAVKATYDGHFDYGAANRPRVMQGNVARVVLLFKQFAQNMIYTMARQAYQSVAGKSPEERRQARKVFAGLLTTHAMAAGVLGLPLVGPLLAAASMLGSDDDEPWDAEVALRNMLAEAVGQKPAEVLAKGVSRLTPWDVSGRVGLDKLIFPDVREGLEGQRWAETFATGMLGPVMGIGTNAARAAQKIGDGDYGRALEDLLPIAARNPIKAARYWFEGAQDRSGVAIKDEVSSAGALGQLVGFSPSEVRLAQEGKTAVMDADRRLNERRAELTGKFAKAAMKQDQAGMDEARQEIAKFNEKNPGRRITAPQLWQSVRRREQRIREAENGVYLPSKRRDAMEFGAFAFE